MPPRSRKCDVSGSSACGQLHVSAIGIGGRTATCTETAVVTNQRRARRPMGLTVARAEAA